MRTLFVVLLTLFIVTGVSANNKNKAKANKNLSVSGKVYSGGEGLTGVKVMLDNEEMTVYTDFDGNFTINNLLPGKHTVSFSMVAYDSKVVTIDPQEENNLSVRLYSK